MTTTPRSFKRLCIFCGSSSGGNGVYAQAAKTAGTELAKRGIGLVYGGGNVGLMGVIADSVLAAGGDVFGVIPEALMAREVGHRGLRDLRVVKTMHERKALMAELSDGFIALPGGIGTFEEFFEIVTWAQLGLHSKPCALFNVSGFYDPLLRLIDHAIQERFVKPTQRDLVIVESDFNTLMQRMAHHYIPHEPKWISKETI
ncbi:MAG TPA: TIGR00730 family Rossman fold protein [Candidatus Angelobacter sp.]|nr:TIGR00730 family Rossman fold protein [Candidatus Angelobacter sp.]